MKPTDFAYYLTDFLSRYLPGTVGLSSNTIMSYRDTFSLFLKFCSEQKKISPEKLSLEHLNRKLTEDYLLWLEKTRKCKASTRNVRLAALHSFCNTCSWNFLIISTRLNKSFRFLSREQRKFLFNMSRSMQ